MAIHLLRSSTMRLLRGHNIRLTDIAAFTLAALLVFQAGGCISSIAGTSGSLPPVDSSAPAPIEPISGSLVIVGGGGTVDPIWARFRQLAGGDTARIVIVPTAAANPDTVTPGAETRYYADKLRLTDVVMLHTRSRDAANTEAFVAPLRRATGVWFVGGVQSRITDAYLRTRTEQEFHAVLARGGVIGGTSAGAAIMTRVMITGQRVVDGDTVATVGEGFGFLPGAVADQHFVRRNRQGRLIGVLKNHPGLVGFGVDERTALVVYAGRRLEVVGESEVRIIQSANARQPLDVRTLRQRTVAATAGAADTAQQDSTAQARAQARANRPAYQADLIALSREAQARTRPRFPALAPPAPEVRKGTLVIVGGGGMPEGLWQRFITLAGGPSAKIVIVPTANGAAEGDSSTPPEVRALRAAGATNIHVLHTKLRSRSNTDEKLLAMVRDAGGVWFGGGRQWNLVDSYQGTTLHRLFFDVLERGGVIGGSSAGASIQGDYMARGDPLGPNQIMAPGYETGLGFLRGVIIDQHFTQRNRHPNMSEAMATYPQLLGIGLDERTAIIVQGSIAEVVGAGNVAIYDRRLSARDGDKDHFNLTAGTRFDLKARRTLTDEKRE
jgi:cyanophycinase